MPTLSAMEIRLATHEDLPAIIEIQNWAIRNTTASFRFYDLDAEERTEWLDEHIEEGFPVLVAEDETGILGYASYMQWLDMPGYRHTMENSIYVSPNAHGKGVGSKLLGELIAQAKKQGDVHVMLANIVSDNKGSLALHKKFGFTEAGFFPEVGRKHGQWLGIYLMQLMIDIDPHDPDVDSTGSVLYAGDADNPHV